MHPRRLPMLMLTMMLSLSMAAPAAAADRDNDGLRDGFEIRGKVTSPDKRDSDGDGVVDSAEDNDRDRLSNLGEQRFGTRPNKKDSDGDGIADGREDRDRDGRSNAREQDQRRLPRNLKPTLGFAVSDAPKQRSTCFSKAGDATLRRCRVGTPDSATTIALIGDSHALMWLSAFERIADERGWSVSGYFKAGCAAVLGIRNGGQYDTDRGSSCKRWRFKLMDAMADTRPDLIVITNLDRYRLVDARGRAISTSRYSGIWEDALKRTISALPSKSAVLVLGDTPHNRSNPVKCLRNHRSNMSACVTRSRPLPKRKVELAMRRAAAARSATFRTLYGKVCSYDPCPVVQGEIMMWRDTGHLTRTFVRRLIPSVRKILVETLSAPARRR